jgi:hypothetical protein
LTADRSARFHANLLELPLRWLGPLLAPFPARTYTIVMGQQLRIRAKRKRRNAYLERHKAKRKAPPPKASRTKGRKEATTNA